MDTPNPTDFERPVYEIWVRNTTNDNRGDSGFSLGRDWGAEFQLRHKTEDLNEARQFRDKFKQPMAVEVKVTWVLNEQAYAEACERAEPARLKTKYEG